MDQITATSNEKQSKPDYASFHEALINILPDERIITDELSRFVQGTDASVYRLTPKLVALVNTETEVVKLCKLASIYNTPITFRAAGTSLSGQAVTDSILVKLGYDGWRQNELTNNGTHITLGPGLTGGQANQKLKPIHKKIGPDPASINSAMIGGIAANNSSGMCCGTEQNTYQTLVSLRLILADGTLLDTGSDISKAAFEKSHPQILNALQDLGEKTKANKALREKITKKFSIKNTMGYSLNALVDFEDPFKILEHLIIGSEGTLGFISQITMNTVDDLPNKSSAIILFEDIHAACRAVAQLKKTPVSAVELMDYASLNSIADNPKLSNLLKGLPKGASGLLIDIRENTDEALNKSIDQAINALAGITPINAIEFSKDQQTYNLYWSIRKGLFPKVGAVRETGTTVIIEDIAVETEKLADAVLNLQDLFKKHAYHEAIIFGHALDGNIHFVFAQSFNTQLEIDRYAAFMDDMAHLIVDKYDGSLKAEHATGRNMAPYVEMEWGKEAFQLMWDIKNILDPHHILNPGVVLTKDQTSHIKNLKQLAAVDPLIDKCIECGFCEATCPTRAITMTPRQRISALRELARLDENETQNSYKEKLNNQFSYEGLDSCAGDGLCQLACPVEIDTGQMMRTLRQQSKGNFSTFIANFIAKHFAGTCNIARVGLSGAVLMRTLVGHNIMQALGTIANKLSLGLIPPWTHDIARPQSPYVTKPETPQREKIVYFSSCASRVLGNSKDINDKRPLAQVIESLFNKAGYDLIQPKLVEGLCCGMPFESKGFFKTADNKTNELLEALKRASNNGQYPIIFDTSPCSLRFKRTLPQSLKIHDITEAIHDFVLDKLDINPIDTPVAFHITCSSQRLGLDPKIKAIMERCSNNTIYPENIQCCGFSGDKGFQLPELNASSLRTLKSQLPKECTNGYSTSRTCEIGLMTHSQRSYQSIAYLVDQCSTSKYGTMNTQD